MSGLDLKKKICLLCQNRVTHTMRCLQDTLFLDRERGAYFNTAGEDPTVLLRVKEDHDGAEPSGNSVSAINLVRLASMVAGNEAEYYKQNAEHLLVCPLPSLHKKTVSSSFSVNGPLGQLQLTEIFFSRHMQAVFENRLRDMAMAVPLMCCAVDMLIVPSRRQVVVVGERSSKEFEDMLATAHSFYDPNKTVSVIGARKEVVFIFFLSSYHK